jgi:DNA-3-methyladenine glycosylase II
MILYPKSTYSFDLFINILSRYAHPSLFSVRDGAYLRTLHIDNTLALVRVTPSSTDENSALVIEPIAGHDAAIVPKMAHVLGIDANLSDFYSMARQDEELWRVVEPLVGLPLYNSESVFEAIIFVIIEQHISWINAQKAQHTLITWGNNCIEFEGQTYYAMVSPSQLANATIDDLKPLKITFKRMQLLIDIAKKVVLGELDLELLLNESPEAMYNELLKIKGIGHWTASVVVSRAMGVYPYVAHNDVALQAAVREYFNVAKSAAATQETFAQYGEYAGLAAHFTLMRWVLDKYPIVLSNEC